TLGLVPAWGGSTRLPRLIGAERAAEVILKGKLHSAREALKLGLIDEVAPRDKLLEVARKKLLEGKRRILPPPKIDKEIPAPRNQNPAPARDRAVAQLAWGYGDSARCRSRTTRPRPGHYRANLRGRG